MTCSVADKREKKQPTFRTVGPGYEEMNAKMPNGDEWVYNSFDIRILCLLIPYLFYVIIQ